MSVVTANRSRRIASISRGLPTSDGAGVKLTRMIGHPDLPQLDPVLLLDQIRSDERDDYIAGFPSHPHRGFETVTIMLDGKMRHGDNKGHSGVIGPGGVQWMTAGRGIVHSEIPEQTDGRLWGFQLWINLPAASKMTDPVYQEFEAGQIPVEHRDGARIRVIAGRLSSGATGPARSAATNPLLLDISLEPGAVFEDEVEAGYTVIAAVYRGAVRVGEAEAGDPSLAVFGDGDNVRLEGGEDGAGVLLIAARPLNEPIARYGPFVMNSEAELHQAIRDFQAGRF